VINGMKERHVLPVGSPMSRSAPRVETRPVDRAA